MSDVLCWFIHVAIRSSSLGGRRGMENELIDSFLHQAVDYGELIRFTDVVTKRATVHNHPRLRCVTGA